MMKTFGLALNTGKLLQRPALMAERMFSALHMKTGLKLGKIYKSEIKLVVDEVQRSIFYFFKNSIDVSS